MFSWKKNKRYFRGSEVSAALDGSACATRGLIVGTRLATNLGWRAVEDLAPGDMVLTFDNDMQPLIDIKRKTVWVDAAMVPQHQWPVLVPADAIGNREDILLMADQGVLTESQMADSTFDDPFAVVRARDLAGLRGITRRPPRGQFELFQLSFAEEQVAYAQGGAMVHCPPSTTLVSDILTFDGPRYLELSPHMAALVVEEFQSEDALPPHLTV